MKYVDQEPKSARLYRGARVRMSEFGRERHPRYSEREGTIVGHGSPSSWRVKFDDRATIQAIHQDYLEAVPISTSSEVRRPPTIILRRRTK